MTLALLGIAVLVVAYANGANDNAKGVAVLAGSRMLSLSAAPRKIAPPSLVRWPPCRWRSSSTPA